MVLLRASGRGDQREEFRGMDADGSNRRAALRGAVRTGRGRGAQPKRVDASNPPTRSPTPRFSQPRALRLGPSAAMRPP